MVSPPAGEVSTESRSRLLGALLELAAGGAAADALPFSELSHHAADMLGAEAGAVLRFLGDERAVVWRAGGTRGMPINAELDFDRRNSALGRARSTGLPARRQLRRAPGSAAGRDGGSRAARLRRRADPAGGAGVGAVVVATTRAEPLAPEAEQRLAELAALVRQAVAGCRAAASPRSWRRPRTSPSPRRSRASPRTRARPSSPSPTRATG
jgi:hypothetical protein